MQIFEGNRARPLDAVAAKTGEDMPLFDYDAYAAMKRMYVRELTKEEIRWESNGEHQFADSRFNTKELSHLTEE